MDEYNRKRREKRRIHSRYTDDDLTVFKVAPTLQELKDALRDVTTDHLAIIRLAALMDNLSLCEGRRVYEGGDIEYRGKTDGIKAYLRKDGYLYSRYSCLMRYRKLGKLIREKSGVDIETNLLWGLNPECPTEDGYPVFEYEYNKLHALYESFKGMNFKQMTIVIQQHKSL
jgi:hypothetical protein